MGGETNVQVFRERRSRVAAAYILHLIHTVCLIALVEATFEVLFKSQDFGWSIGRCLVYDAASMQIPGKIIASVLLILNLGLTAVYEDVSRKFSWAMLVIGSLVGVACSAIVFRIVQVDGEAFIDWTQLQCASTATDARRVMNEQLLQFLLGLAAWFIGIICVQLGLRRPQAPEGMAPAGQPQ